MPLASRTLAEEDVGRYHAKVLAAVGLLVLVAAADYGLNLYACVTTQKEFVRANREMGRWIRNNVPRHSMVLCNFYNMPDVFHYSGYSFDPYQTKANCPLRRLTYADDTLYRFEGFDRGGSTE